MPTEKAKVNLKKILKDFITENKKDFPILISPTKSEIINYVNKLKREDIKNSAEQREVALKYVIGEDGDIYIGPAFSTTHAAILKKAKLTKEIAKGRFLVGDGKLIFNPPTQGRGNKNLDAIMK